MIKAGHSPGLYLSMDKLNNPPDINETVVFSVSEVTYHLKQVIETQIESLYVKGEISSFVRHSSGHIYFNLKDENAVIRCAFFRNQNYMLEFQPQDGDQVICFGRVSVFEKSGQYQLILSNMFEYGKGALQQKYEQLKQKLKSEGLFDSIHKKSLPRYPDYIGIITSPTGAALQDILNILKRRYPCNVSVYPSLMQGNDAPGQVAKGIAYFNTENNVDLIIIARGGGSQEDLFCFNDEMLARAIYSSKLPIISAIGHEIDFTISDFVADLRAPTPSAAAELCTPEKTELVLYLNSFMENMLRLIQFRMLEFHNQLHLPKIRIMRKSPESVLQTFQQRFDQAITGFGTVKEKLDNLKKEFEKKQSNLLMQWKTKKNSLNRQAVLKIQIALNDINYAQHTWFLKRSHMLELISRTMDDLSPQQVLDRGYSILQKEGKTVSSIHVIKPEDKLVAIVKDGKAQVKVLTASIGKTT
jgi:exodeoxyribonuclease VII large subunit